MKAYLIPGSGEDLESRDYQAVLDMYKDCGYDPVFVPIKWKYKTIDDWVAQVKDQLPEKEISQSLLSGFSYGSMIALTVAAEINPKKLLLFSLSPYFKEDMPLPKNYEVWAGKRRIDSFRNLSFNNLASKINCPALVFFGSKEIDKYDDLRRRSKEAKKRIKDSSLVVVDGAGHDVGDPKYVAEIKKSLS